jgi:Xaa-Pro dipeptidase
LPVFLFILAVHFRFLHMQIPFSELSRRLNCFRQIMNIQNPDWELGVIFSKVNLYYYTGTMQEGMLLIPRNDEAVFWVRRSFERAKDESLFPVIKQMESFKDAAASINEIPKTIFLETEIVPLAMLQRFQKYFPSKSIRPLDGQVSWVRARKSSFELALMEHCGEIHGRVLEGIVPGLLYEGISEVDFALEIYSAMVREGHQGQVRFGMFDTEMVLGHVAFGESSIYPTSFNGPGGNYGVGPAVPSLGSRTRKLKTGDLVFVDIGCGYCGYHTDKTMTYIFRETLPVEAQMVHRQCVEIQMEIASMLKPGSIPSSIYQEITGKLSPEFLQNFMGFGNRQVKFLGHGIGLTIDEAPVIAKGFDDPIEEGMVFALEPKKGIPNIGMVGIENTFIVTKDGGKCITGDNPGLIFVA